VPRHLSFLLNIKIKQPYSTSLFLSLSPSFSPSLFLTLSLYFFLSLSLYLPLSLSLSLSLSLPPSLYFSLPPSLYLSLSLSDRSEGERAESAGMLTQKVWACSKRSSFSQDA